MKEFDATEQAYNNGYEAGKKEAATEILTKIYNDSCEDLTNGIYWVEVPKENFINLAKEYGIDLDKIRY